MSSPTDLLTAEEVADRLRVSTGTVYTLIRERKIAAIRVGKQLRIRRDELDRVLSPEPDPEAQTA